MGITFMLVPLLAQCIFANPFASFGQCTSCGGGGNDFEIEEANSNLDFADAYPFGEDYRRYKRDLQLETLPEDELMSLLNAIKKSNLEQNQAIAKLITAKELAKEFGVETEDNKLFEDRVVLASTDMNTDASEQQNVTAKPLEEAVTTTPTPVEYAFVFNDGTTENPIITGTPYDYEYVTSTESATTESLTESVTNPSVIESEKAADVTENEVTPVLNTVPLEVEMYQVMPQVQILPQIYPDFVQQPIQYTVPQPNQYSVPEPTQYSVQQPTPYFPQTQQAPCLQNLPGEQSDNIEFSTSDVIIENGKPPVIKSHTCRLHSSHVTRDVPQQPTHYLFL